MTLANPGRALLAAFLAGAFAGWRPRSIPTAERGVARMLAAVTGIALTRAIRSQAVHALMSYAHKHVVADAPA